MYNTIDTTDCTPHISRFLSFNRVAVAMHILGLWRAPFLVAFLRSLWLTTAEKILKTVGALDCKSLIRASQLNAVNLSTGTLWKNKTLAVFLWQSSLHSWLINSRNFISKSFLRSSFANTVLAIDGRCPPTSIRPIFSRFGGSVNEYGVVRIAELTVILSG